MIDETILINKITELTEKNIIKWYYLSDSEEAASYMEIEPFCFHSRYKGQPLYIQRGWICINNNFNVKNQSIDSLFEIIRKIYKIERNKYYQDYEEKAELNIRKVFEI